MSGDLAAGQEFAGYRVVRRLGQGGMSVVYLAEHIGLERRAALKILSPALAGDDDFRQRFVRESKLAASLDHPNIVPVFDAGEVDGTLYIAMRYVDGEDLRVVLERDRRIAPERTLAVLAQVGSALDAAHERGLCHRDVKPGNILLGAHREGQREHAYLADFGLTKQSGAESTALTRTGQFLGTLDYIAPEQVHGGAVDGRVDVYALGCVLYECLAGARPYPRDTEVAVIAAHLFEPPPRLSALRPDLPVAVDDVVATAMAKAPADRYPSCAALVEAARVALDGGASAVPWGTAAAAAGAGAGAGTVALGSVGAAAWHEAGAPTSMWTPGSGPPPPSGPPPQGPPSGPPPSAGMTMSAGSGPLGGPPSGPPPGPPSGPPSGPPPFGSPPGGAGPPPPPGPPGAGWAPPPGGPPGFGGPPGGGQYGDVGPDEDDEERRRRALAVPWWRSPVGMGALGLAAVAAIAGLVILVTRGDSAKSSAGAPVAQPVGQGEVFLQPATQTGANPFTPSVALATAQPSGGIPRITPPIPTAGAASPGGQTTVTSYPGSIPGLYGGTRSVSNCDSRQLVAFLMDKANSLKAAAWAEAQGIKVSDIPSYVASLTPVVLRADTRVTNHGFAADVGVADAYQSVLEAGTAVLVDNYGVPRVRCYCGNPLKEPVPTTVTPTYKGDRWPAFTPATVVVVVPPPKPVTQIIIVDVFTSKPFARAPGQDVSKDTDAPPGALGTLTPAPATAPATAVPTAPPATPVPTPGCDGAPVITGQGAVSASSTYNANFPASLAVDGDRSTSWFSAGTNDPHGDDSWFTWKASSPRLICRIQALSNAQNANPDIRQGFTFTSVTVMVFAKDGDATPVKAVEAPVNDQDVSVDLGGAVGTVVRLVFHHHVTSNCGGFSELIVNGR